MANQEIRKKAAAKNIKLWKIADKIGITDSHFSRKLRKEFAPEKKAEIMKIIDELAQEQEAG